MKIIFEGFKSRINFTCSVFVLAGFIVSSNLFASSGINWLIEQQQPDGSFYNPISVATSLQATSETINTLYFVDLIPPSNVSATHQFLETEPYASTENLARQIIAKVKQGRDHQSLITELYQQQNSDGGLAEFHQYQSAVLDTASALETLYYAGENGNTDLETALNYILLHQNEDGGWSDGNNQSQVFITAIVLNALSGYQRSHDLSVTITAAQNYLLQQAENNQWAETHLSALALLALVNTLDDVSLIVDHLSVLRAQQL